ncbi:MAG: site-specific DNA-methyltransferase [Bacteroidales bacterium]|jgi:adenine-specific DNA-methyltransferase|nr:site-specific DNA-methyltransferase [Bacteroidales bacterium]
MSIPEKLSNLLLACDKYLISTTDDKPILNKTLISSIARNYDVELLSLLQNDQELKQHFFTILPNGVAVFKLNTFLTFINNREFLPDSFTAYKNRIGLATDKDHYLKNNKDVVLNWAYKDCVLEGGQTKEEDKRAEVFFNEVLAPDQINRLLDDKVFTNWKRYDKDGEHKVSELQKTDNLIIKGNNLVVLHSLKKRFAGKVKLIYIDPPYNTGNDSFGYNDRFNHSTWLTFMKNRLEVAKELLAEDGSIYINLDYNETHYCKILMDEIFGKENSINDIVWNYRGTSNSKQQFAKKHDNIISYSKTRDYFFNADAVRVPYDDMGKFNQDNEGKWYQKWDANKNYYPKQEFIDEKWVILGKNQYDVWNDIPSMATSHGKEFLAFAGQKPEALIERIILASTNQGDIILDYHLGSGTTAAVAHKMGRQYIGVEQMDYIETVSVERLKKVIDGEQGGISKSQNWQGGGEFVYCELANDAEEFRREVMIASADKLNNLFEKAKNSSFLSYHVNNAEFNGFETLSEQQKRELLCQIVDSNTLYINYDDIDDLDYKVSDADKKLNKAFYNDNGE